MKNFFIIILSFSIFQFAEAQKRTAYILVKQVKGEKFRCLAQDVSYEIITLDIKLETNSKKRNKVLEVYKKRLKNGEKKRI